MEIHFIISINNSSIMPHLHNVSANYTYERVMIIGWQ